MFSKLKYNGKVSQVLLSGQFRQRFVSGSFRFVSCFLSSGGDTWEDVCLASAARRQLLKIHLSFTWGAVLIRPLRCILCVYTHTHVGLVTFLRHVFDVIFHLVFDISEHLIYLCPKGTSLYPRVPFESSLCAVPQVRRCALSVHGSFKGRKIVFVVSLFRLQGQSRKAHLVAWEDSCGHPVSGNVYSV